MSDRIMKQVDQDPVVYESALKKEQFSYNKVLYGVLSVYTNRQEKMLGYVYTTPQVTQGMKTTLDRASLTAAIFKEYFGMPMGIRSVFTRAFRSKRELQCIFLGKKEIIITSKHGTTIFFPITIFFYENLKKKWLEKRA